MFFKHYKHKGPHHGMGHGFRGGRPTGMGRGEGRMGRGGGRRRLFDSAALQLITLHLIELQPRHGYDLIREIEDMSGGVYAPSPGVIYPTLTLLADMELIEDLALGSNKKIFQLTEAGKRHLAENAETVAQLAERLSGLASGESTADHTPVVRALDNLTNVLRHRLSRDGTAMTNIHDAAALIDDAAQKIERL